MSLLTTLVTAVLITASGFPVNVINNNIDTITKITQNNTLVLWTC